MKKRMVVLTMAVAACAAVTGLCTAQAKTRTELIVGFDPEYPPYGYLDENTGEYTGFDLEFAQAAADREGWELVKMPIDWETKDEALDNGTVDCIWSGFSINDREDEYEWSYPYLNNYQVIVVRDDSEIRSPKDLAEKYVGVQGGSTAASLLEKDGENGQKKLAATFGAIMEYPEYSVAFTELEAGTIDALIVDSGAAAYYLKDNSGLRILDEKLSSEQYAVAFKLGKKSLRDKINGDILTLADEGFVLELALKYDLQDMICIGVE